MKHFKKILATTDLTSESLSTVRYAVHLAKAQNASLTVLHVPPLPATLYSQGLLAIDLANLEAEFEQAARKHLDRWVKSNARSVPTRVLVRQGIVHETIAAVAKEMGASLIVMSTHGRKGVRHVMLGSVTERVLREATCPVLVVRPGHGEKAAGRAAATRSKKAA